MLQFGDPHSVPPEEIFNPRRSVVSVLETNDFRRRASLFRKAEKVGISRYNDKLVAPCIFPNRFVRSELGEVCVKNVNRPGKKLCKPPDEPGREIRVKKKPQRERRSRPNWEA